MHQGEVGKKHRPSHNLEFLTIDEQIIRVVGSAPMKDRLLWYRLFLEL